MPTKRATRVIECWRRFPGKSIERVADEAVKLLLPQCVTSEEDAASRCKKGERHLPRRITIIVEDLPAKAKKGASK